MADSFDAAGTESTRRGAKRFVTLKYARKRGTLRPSHHVARSAVATRTFKQTELIAPISIDGGTIVALLAYFRRTVSTIWTKAGKTRRLAALKVAAHLKAARRRFEIETHPAIHAAGTFEFAKRATAVAVYDIAIIAFFRRLRSSVAASGKRTMETHVYRREGLWCKR